MVRHIFGGVHPEVEMTRRLTEAGYGATAPLLGHVARFAPDGTCHVLAIVQGFIRNQGDAWGWILESLKRSVEEALLGLGEGAAEMAEPFENETAFMRTIGRRLGELHQALLEPVDDPAFAPGVAGPDEVAAWLASAEAELNHAFGRISERKGTGDAALDAVVDEVLQQREAILARLPALAEAAAGSPVIRIHGDFHLGQILVAQGDAFIIDFEGEPAKDLAARRAKSSPMRDVAGLIRSIDYAAASIDNPEEEPATGDHADRRRALLARFRKDAVAAFLEGYRQAQAEGEETALEGRFGDLLDLFLIEKAAYEVSYEAASRPRWLPIPLRGLAGLAARVTGGAG